jgi:putative DNA primase/helicase
MHDATSIERVRSALSYLNPAVRDVWVRAAACIKSEFPDGGFEIWDQWGSQCDSYSASAARSVWKSIKSAGRLTIASLFYDAKSAGWVDSGVHAKRSRAEIDADRARAAARAAQAAVEEAAVHEDRAVRAQQIWGAAAPAETHPYLERKGVPSHGLRVGPWERVDPDTGESFVVTRQSLLIPIRDNKGKLWSLQGIDPEEGGKKRYFKDGAKQGNFFAIGKPQQHEGRALYILGEGYATCASVHAATGHLVLVCFDTSNLSRVAEKLRASKPDAIILFAADNDTETVERAVADGLSRGWQLVEWTTSGGAPAAKMRDGTRDLLIENPGVTKAVAAAAAVNGLVAVPPPGDFNDLQHAEGLEAVAGVIDAALAPAPAPVPPDDVPPWDGDPTPTDDAPPEGQPSIPALDGEDEALLDHGHFAILGYDGDYYYFFHRAKRMVLHRSRQDFSDMGLAELAPTTWWEMHFAGQKGGINKVQAFEWIMAIAHRRGVYDPRNVRGRGAWRDNGRAVFHHGDYLSVDGVKTDITDIESRWVYPMSRTMTPPAETPLSDEDGRHLLDVAKMARWTRPGSAALLAGWVFLSPIGGALSWRPHVWITGAAGSGKSTIQSDYVEALLSGISEPFQGDSTEPGIRQTLRADAVPALIDEFEPNDEADRKRMKSIMMLMRQSSSEGAHQTAKGTVSGDSMRFHIRSMFCVASINTMLDKDSDQSRITPLVLRPPAKSGASDDQWKQLEEALHKIKRDGTWPSRILSRGLRLLPTVIANVEVFCRVAAIRFGTQRQGDQYGTLLAGAWSLSSSKVASDADAFAMINSYDWTDHTDVSGGPGDPEKALAAIMEAKIRVANSEVTVYEILSEAVGHQVSSTSIGAPLCVDILRRNGIMIEDKAILFGVRSTNLNALVKDTAYVTDLRGQLSRLPGATNYGNRTRKYAGTNSKVITVPLALVLEDEEPPI